MPDLQNDITELRTRLQTLGLYERPAGRMLAAWGATLVVAGASLWGALAADALWVRAPLFLVSCAACLSVATTAHTASHQALSKSRWVNELVLYVSYPLLLQLSARYWHRSHIQVHHPAPNVVGVDDDCDLMPFFALNARDLENAGRLRRAFSRVQGFVLPLVLPLNGFSMQRQGWAYLLSQLRTRKGRNAATYLDVACMVLHLVLWLGVPCLFFPASKVFAVYAMRVALMGIGLFAILAPGHFPADAECLADDQRGPADFYLRQTVATVNFRTGLVGRWLCNGLEYQIEHHLFPSISHVHLEALSEHVRALCARHGMPYRSYGWGRAIWESYRVFFTPKRVVTDVESLRGDAPVSERAPARRAA